MELRRISEVCISCIFISNSNLEKYIKKHSEINPTFCITGFQRTSDTQWAFIVRLTASNDAVVDENLVDSKRQIYSIHKTRTINADSLACFDKSLEQDPVSHPSLISFPWKYKPVLVKKPKVASPRPSPIKLPQHQKSAPDKSVPSVATAAPRKSTKRQLKSRVQSSLNFEPTKKEVEKPSQIPESESAPNPFADSDEDEYKAEARAIQIKRRRMVFSSDEEDAEDLSVNSKENKKIPEMDIESPLKRVSKKSAKSPKTNHKLSQKATPTKSVISTKTEKMPVTKKKDDLSEEEMIKLAPSQGVKPVRSPSPSRASNPRKRQVTKTFTDNDGFLITERVWEEVDEADAEPEKTEPAKSLPGTKVKSGLSPVKNATNSKLKKAKQATLMGFFKS
ncbi:hypothetical protein Aperf_G00000049707 [Anoplocephala perfoliata]